MCLRLRRRRAVSAPDLPPPGLGRQLADAVAPMRARLLRRAGIAHRGPVLDLGAGWGFVTEELVRRARGPVVALDRRAEAIAALSHLDARAIQGEASDLPFDCGYFDLVLCQQVLMWQRDLAPVLREIRRVLREGGVLVALEPDWGGAIEHPRAIAVADVARAALTRAGADPFCGRALPAALHTSGFARVRVDLVPAPSAPDDTRFDLLDGLPLHDAERAELARARAAQAALPPAAAFVHVPCVCTTASH